MALTSTERSLCNSLVQKFDPVLSPIRSVKESYRDKVAEFNAELRAQKNVFVDPWDVTSAVTDLQGQVQEELPGDTLEDMDRLKRFIAGCGFFSDSNPVGTILGGTLGVFGKIDQLIDNSAITVPQIGLGKLADTINNILSGITIPGGSNISDLLKKGDLLIDCLSGLCGPEFGVETLEFTDTIDSLFDAFNVVKDPINPDYGKFDFTSVYSSVGLDSTQIASMNIAVKGITDIKSGALASITSASNKAKSLIGLGGFF